MSGLLCIQFGLEIEKRPFQFGPEVEWAAIQFGPDHVAFNFQAKLNAEGWVWTALGGDTPLGGGLGIGFNLPEVGPKKISRWAFNSKKKLNQRPPPMVGTPIPSNPH